MGVTAYVVLNVTGPNATHHLTSGEGWHINGSYLTDQAECDWQNREWRRRQEVLKTARRRATKNLRLVSPAPVVSERSHDNS